MENESGAHPLLGWLGDAWNRRNSANSVVFEHENGLWFEFPETYMQSPKHDESMWAAMGEALHDATDKKLVGHCVVYAECKNGKWTIEVDQPLQFDVTP
jgi:hypothetical protein